jgi:phosphoenolpyruvate phosphomutase
VPTTYNYIPDIDLAEAGFDIIIHANHLLRASYKAMKGVADKILADGCSKNLDIASVKEIFHIVGYDKY